MKARQMTALRRLNLHYAPTLYSSKSHWERYAKWLRRHMTVSLALAPEPVRTPLKVKLFGRWQGDGYTCEKVYFESMPGYYVTGNLFRPTASRRKHPVVLCPHGHWPDGRLHDRDPRSSVIARCIQLARMGAFVFSHDMVGYNDSCQLQHGFATDPHFGMSLMALHTWNSLRGLDFLLSLPGADPKRVGVTGASGGGTQTFVLAAIDPRVTVAAPICMISYHMQGGCLCENAPLLRIAATSVDIARLMAPKPQFMGSCTGDWTKNTATEEFPAIRNIYDLYGATDRLLHHQVDFGHNYNQEMREHVYGFFNRFLFGAESTAPIQEVSCERPPHRDRMVWWGKIAPDPMSYEKFQQLWRTRTAAALQPHLRNAETARKGLGKLLPAALGVTLDSVAEYRRKAPEFIRVESSGDTLAISPLTPEPPTGIGEISHIEGYNRTRFAGRVNEILAAVENAGGRVRLRGHAEAGSACLVAAALTPRVASVEADMLRFDPQNDAHWAKFMDTPAIRQVGGLATVFALIGKRPIKLHHATNGVRQLLAKYAQMRPVSGTI